jgi:hypothetical protein
LCLRLLMVLWLQRPNYSCNFDQKIQSQMMGLFWGKK